jgi:hypothetical protein
MTFPPMETAQQVRLWCGWGGGSSSF